MNPSLLIAAVVRQTTVLLAQLSTSSAGLRSPLVHVADQVFLSLAQEIEQQGVSRKVVADMFGLALRSYQRKVQRLSESASVSGRTLWESVLDFVAEREPIRRTDVFERFQYDDPRAVTAVLSDLVTSGLLYASGRGDATAYRATSAADWRALSGEDADEALAIVLWGTVFRAENISTRELLAVTRADAERVTAALSLLLADGRVTCEGTTDDAPLHAAPFLIPVGASVGWEAAVFDHFQAVANAIAAKAKVRVTGGAPDASLGGSTVHFGLHPGHPYEERVRGLLEKVRAEVNALWDEVTTYNREHAAPDETTSRHTFYFGQYMVAPVEPKARGDVGSEDEDVSEQVDS